MQIYVMNANGTNQTIVSNDPQFADWVGWSPDGNGIAFTSGRDLDREIYIMTVDGSIQERLTDTLLLDSHANWGP